MNRYEAPINEILYVLNNFLDSKRVFNNYNDIDKDSLNSIIVECGKLSEKILFPINKIGDRFHPKLINGNVICHESFVNAYKKISADGWIGLGASKINGGLGLPLLIITAINEMMSSGCLSLALNFLLTRGQIEALEEHSNNEINNFFLPNLVSGKWCGTMNLTEPQAGTDVGNIKTQASLIRKNIYSIKGQKIYISWGDHNLTENICHLVLARCKNSPNGVKGISLFIVPKYLFDKNKVKIDNGISTISLENKMGLHASPTAVLEFNDSKGWLIGKINDGLSAMFTMMNNARLGVGIQGLSQSQIAYNYANSFAKNREQGYCKIKKTKKYIIEYPDVRRNLLTMKAFIISMRYLCYQTALYLDEGKIFNNNLSLKKGEFLIPVAKAFCTDISCRVTDIGIQIHGGMGYVAETGVEQFYRDVRVTSIYEGTNGIQAIDLIGRKMKDGGKIAFEFLKEISLIEDESFKINGEFKSTSTLLRNARIEFESTLKRILKKENYDDILAGASPFLKSFGLLICGSYLLKSALISKKRERFNIAKFYIEQLLPEMYSNLKSADSSFENLLICDL